MVLSMPKLWCYKYPIDVSRLSELPECFRPPHVTTLVEFRARISEWFPGADTNASRRGCLILGSDYTISIMLFVEDDSVEGFYLNVRGEDSVVPAVRRIIDGFGVRACDLSTGEFWDMEAGLRKALREWREGRDGQIREAAAD